MSERVCRCARLGETECGIDLKLGRSGRSGKQETGFGSWIC
jgi:hypothetical protein